jgi:hypothetical protein
MYIALHSEPNFSIQLLVLVMHKEQGAEHLRDTKF